MNPFTYAFEGLVGLLWKQFGMHCADIPKMTNEFSDRVMQCSESQLVPRGPGYDDSRYQGCALPGARVGSLLVPGSEYLAVQFDYSRRYLWRNFGVIIAFTVLYILVTVIAMELLSFAGSGQGALVFRKAKEGLNSIQGTPPDEEKVVVVGKQDQGSHSQSSGEKSEEDDMKHIAKSESIFTWEDVQYTVPYLGGERKILNGVSGYAKPGLMVALMGASGAGKYEPYYTSH